MSTSTTSGFAVAEAPVRVIEPWKPGTLHRLTETWRYRRLIPFIGMRFLERRYRNTWLGWLWVPLRPMLDILTKALLFGGFLSVSSGDRPYIIFFTFGTCGWIVFDSTNKWAVRGMRISEKFVKNAHAPWLLRLMGVLYPAAFDFVLYLLTAFIALFYYLFAKGTWYLVPSRQLVVAGLGLLLLVLLGLGLGLLTSPWSVYSRDVRFTFGYFMQFFYYITPVVYPISQLPPQFQPIAIYNPLTAPVEMVKYGFLQTAPPKPASVMVCLITLAILLPVGIWLFGRFERAAVSRL